MPTEVREEHARKARASITVTPSGMMTDVRLAHDLKVSTGILETWGGMVKLVKPVPENALTPIAVTLAGSEMFVRPVQPSKAEALMEEYDGGMVADDTASQLYRTHSSDGIAEGLNRDSQPLKTWTPSLSAVSNAEGTLALVSEVELENAPTSIVVSDSGRDMDVSPDLENAYIPRCCKPKGSTMFVRPVHS